MGFLSEIATEIQQRSIAASAPSGVLPELVAGEFVESEKTQVRLMETPGLGGVRVQERQGVKYVLQTMQIAVRGTDYLSAREVCQELYNFLNGGIRNTFLSGIYYLSLDVLQTPEFLGRDENDRWFFGFNMVAFKHPS